MTLIDVIILSESSQSIKTLEICVAVRAGNHVDRSLIHYHYTNGSHLEKEANMIYALLCTMVSFSFIS